MEENSPAKFLKRGAWLALALVPPLLFVLNCNEGWHQGYGLWETWRYLVNDALLAVMALEAAVLGFLFRHRSRVVTGIGLCVSSLLMFLVMFDLYVVLLCHQSTGPGGILCISHRNWYERIAIKNSHDYWERELQAYMPTNRPDDLVVIAAVGDSFTWGQGLARADERFTNLLDQSLGDKVVVLNFGRGGYNTQDIMTRIMPDVTPLKPPIVVMFYLSNDIHDGLTKVAPPPPPPAEKWEHRALVGFPAWNFLYWKVFAKLQFEETAMNSYDILCDRYEDEKNFQAHKSDLQEFARQVRAGGSLPVVVNLPFPHLWENVGPERSARVKKRILDALESTGMPLLDLSELESQFPAGQFEVNSMDAHPKAEVHAAIAQKVEPWLRTIVAGQVKP